MKPSEALRVARNRIENDEHTVISLALPYNKAGREVRHYINSAIGGRMATYATWLEDNHKKLFETMYGEDIKQGCIQWIDWMIEQYEGIGQ